MSSPTRFMSPSSRSTGTRMLGPLGELAGRGAGRGSASRRARNSGRATPGQVGASGGAGGAIGVGTADATMTGSEAVTGSVRIASTGAASSVGSATGTGGGARAEVMMARRSWVAPARASAVSSEIVPPDCRTCLIAVVPTKSASVTAGLRVSRFSRTAPSRSSI